MKKMIVMTLLIMGAAGVKAQSLEIIPKAGINIATQNIKGESNESSKIGFQGGLGLNIHTGARGLSIQPELNFVGKGTAIKSGATKNRYNLNYLEVPVLAKYSLGPVYVNGGPSVGVLLGKDNNLKALYGNFKKIDLGVQLGAGLALPAGSGKVIVDGRYTQGLSNISAVKGTNIRNRGFAVSLGYAISL